MNVSFVLHDGGRITKFAFWGVVRVVRCESPSPADFFDEIRWPSLFNPLTRSY